MANKINYAKLYTLRTDGRYQGYYYDEKGIRHAVTDRDPKNVYDKIQQKTAPRVRIFSNACSDWESSHREQVTVRTWNNYAPHLKQMMQQYGSIAVADVTAQMVMLDLDRAKAKGFSRTVVNSRRVIWSGVLRNEVLLGYIQFNPVDSVKLPKGLPHSVRKAPLDKQMKIVLRSVDVPFGFYPFFLLCTGLRKSEALALTWGDINLKDRQISVTKSLEYISTEPRVKTPKTEAGIRSVPIIDVLYDELRKRKQKKKSALLFPAAGSNRAGVGGGYMTERGFDVAWKNYCEATGVGSLTAHQLRHGTATLLIESGVDAETTQHILGHSNISTTLDIYVELREAKLKRDASKLNDVMANLMAESSE